MRRPAPRTVADIRHPGPRADERRPMVPCTARAVRLQTAADRPLLEALGSWADAEGYASAVLDLGGISLAGFDYVMPDRTIDDRHAAWYSDTHTSRGARLEEAVAVLGWRDGNWFAHIHAYWREDGQDHLGHLLPHTLTCAAPADISGFGLLGARFEAELDPETEFILFRVRHDPSSQTAERDNALITTLAPFEDLHHSVEALAQSLDTADYSVRGLGSFAGAGFQNAPPMTGLISEILLKGDAGSSEGTGLSLPVRCVDLEGRLSEGTVSPGQAPTLVTCELLITETGATT